MNSIGGGRRLVRWAAVAALALAWAGPARAQENLDIKFEIKGQIFLETTDFGTGLDRQGSRTDIHFQRLRLVATAKFNDIWGFKFQTCGNCGTSKQGALGYGLTAQDVDWNDRDIRIIDGYAHRELLRAVPAEDRTDQAAADAREPRRLLRPAVAGPVVLRLQRLRQVAGEVQPRLRRRGLGRLQRRQAALLHRRLPGAGGRRQDAPSLHRRHRHVVHRAQQLVRVRRPRALRVPRRRAGWRVHGLVPRRPEGLHHRCRLRLRGRRGLQERLADGCRAERRHRQLLGVRRRHDVRVPDREGGHGHGHRPVPEDGLRGRLQDELQRRETA